jgi:hypothetical protein
MKKYQIAVLGGYQNVALEGEVGRVGGSRLEESAVSFVPSTARSNASCLAVSRIVLRPSSSRTVHARKACCRLNSSCRAPY